MELRRRLRKAHGPRDSARLSSLVDKPPVPPRPFSTGQAWRALSLRKTYLKSLPELPLGGTGGLSTSVLPEGGWPLAVPITLGRRTPPATEYLRQLVIDRCSCLIDASRPAQPREVTARAGPHPGQSLSP